MKRTIELITQEKACSLYKKSATAFRMLRNNQNILIEDIHYIRDGRNVLYIKEMLDHWRLNSNPDGTAKPSHIDFCQKFQKDKEKGLIEIKELQEV